MRCETCKGSGKERDANFLGIGIRPKCPDCAGTGESNLQKMQISGGEITQAPERIGVDFDPLPIDEMEPLPADFAKVWDDNIDALVAEAQQYKAETPDWLAKTKPMDMLMEVRHREGGERPGEFGKGGWQ